MPISSRKIALGSRLPWFQATDLKGGVWTPQTIVPERPVIVAFICNHSPYVHSIQHTMGQMLGSDIRDDFTVLAISSNDVESYPNDSLEAMARQSKDARFTFPYCLDVDQEIAKAFGASCTPEFFLFDQQWRLVYHGQFDDSRPENGHRATGDSLARAMTAVIERRVLDADQPHAFGCSIKWKSGNEPEYSFASATPAWLMDF
jgi:hypothetical protein